MSTRSRIILVGGDYKDAHTMSRAPAVALNNATSNQANAGCDSGARSVLARPI